MEAIDPVVVARGLPEMEFHDLAPFNESAFAVFRADGPGAGPWEMHPDTEELLYALEGEVTIDVLTDEGTEAVRLRAGSFFVVPRGHWHRHRDTQDLVELYFTPGTSLHSTADDPRQDA